jgi:hypothetical protein
VKQIKGLKIDWEGGYGGIDLDQKFKADHPMLRADVLQDWIVLLTEEYSKARVDLGWSAVDVKFHEEEPAE